MEEEVSEFGWLVLRGRRSEDYACMHACMLFFSMYSPGFFDCSFENVARGVDEDVEAAGAGVKGVDGRFEGF